ncbi:hypothetical protein VEZ01S_44_00370 [Vibrio ezurae NBRC 102218]|uniref:Uncharacterized protein n=2 Tax=Vibrio ezurae TaxID=252583 RepID=U3CI50_9VIBR|nr:hypothetical protein VEZ01S_44_00370 [Vibrio ezurae NBRC 102218]
MFEGCMNIKPIQFVILGVIVGFSMNGLYDMTLEARSASMAKQSGQSTSVTFSNCTLDAKNS